MPQNNRSTVAPPSISDSFKGECCQACSLIILCFCMVTGKGYLHKGKLHKLAHWRKVHLRSTLPHEMAHLENSVTLLSTSFRSKVTWMCQLVVLPYVFCLTSIECDLEHIESLSHARCMQQRGALDGAKAEASNGIVF